MAKPTNQNLSVFKTVTQTATSSYVQMAGALLFSYLAGPYVSTATREAFPHAYGTVYGAVPEPYSIAYYSTYLPAREHACGYAYNNGTTILLGLCAGAIAAAKLAPQALAGVKKLTSFLWGSKENQGNPVDDAHESMAVAARL